MLLFVGCGGTIALSLVDVCSYGGHTRVNNYGNVDVQAHVVPRYFAVFGARHISISLTDERRASHPHYISQRKMRKAFNRTVCEYSIRTSAFVTLLTRIIVSQSLGNASVELGVGLGDRCVVHGIRLREISPNTC